MTTIAQILGITAVGAREIEAGASEAYVDAKDISIGIEVELEDCSAGDFLAFIDRAPRWWKVKSDSSLRGERPVEILGGIPLPGARLPEITSQFSKAMEAYRLRYRDPVASYRTSTHVHLDCRRMTSSQLAKAILLGNYFDKLFSAAEAPSRLNLNFCVSASDYARELGGQIALLQKRAGLQYLTLGAVNYRYAAVNIASVLAHGSLEFRQFPGTLSGEDLLQWASWVQKIGWVALQNDDIFEWITYLISVSPEEAITKVMGQPLGTKLVEVQERVDWSSVRDLLAITHLAIINEQGT